MWRFVLTVMALIITASSAIAADPTAPPLQHRQTPFIAGISAASSADFYARDILPRWNASYAVVSLTLVQNIRQAKAMAGADDEIPF